MDTRSTDAAEKLDLEGRLHAILETAVEAIITIDERGLCESFNAAAEKMFGYTAAEIVGQNVSMLMPSPFREAHDEYLAAYLRTGDRKIIGIGREVIGLRQSGEQFPIHLAVSEVQLESRRIFTGFIQDITDRKEAERRLVQSERLAVLGEAMARLAHEGRNSLQRIQIAVETARIHCEETGPLATQLGAIENASDGLDSLLDELRNFAAPLSLDKRTLAVSRIWREAWQLIRPAHADRSVTVQEDIQADDTECEVDHFRLAQVFRNLFENSLAACTDPTQINILAREIGESDGAFLQIRFADNGHGLDANQKQRIFEPLLHDPL